MLLNSTYSTILPGCQRGILYLQMTYDLNVSSFSVRNIEMPNEKIRQRKNIHFLGADDLSAIAAIAFANNWYDTAIMFIKEAQYSFDYLLTKHSPMTIAQYQKGKLTLNEMCTLLTYHHNMILLKNKDSFGVDYKTFPFILDQGEV